MDSDELAEQLRSYVGQRVRISSGEIGWRGDDFPILKSVTVTAGRVWCHADSGVSWVVGEDGLLVSVEPAIGTSDFAAATAQMAAIGAALKRYGCTPQQKSRRCHCPPCSQASADADAAHEASYATPITAPAVPEPRIIDTSADYDGLAPFNEHDEPETGLNLQAW